MFVGKSNRAHLCGWKWGAVVDHKKYDAACGFAVLFEDAEGQLYFHGIFGCVVGVVPRDWSFMGTEKMTSGATEINGIGWVMFWILQFGHTRFRVHYDCEYAAMGAEARGTPKSNEDLVIVVAGLTSLVCRQFDISLEHVYAHRGHPWNELADHVCNVVSLRGMGFNGDRFRMPLCLR